MLMSYITNATDSSKLFNNIKNLEILMIKITMLGLAAVISIGLLTVPAYADTTSPVFSNVPDTIKAVTDSISISISGVVINYDLPTARDDISGNTVVVCNPQSGHRFPIGETTITCQTQDDSGNMSEVSFSVIFTLVESVDPSQIIPIDASILPLIAKALQSMTFITSPHAPVDITPPTLVLPADITAEATGVMTQVNLGSATATDLVDSSPTITRSPTTDIFPVGTHTITWTGTDDAGNTASDTQIITIQDTTPPTISAPSDVTLEATSLLSMISLGNAIATDLVDTFPTITSDAPASFPVGITTITYTATDDVGNFATDTQTVTIQDTTSPMLVLPADVTAEATGILTALDIGTVTITDDVANNITATNDAPASFPLGDTIVTWSGTDTAGNTVTDTQTVTVQDTTAPVVGVIDDITSEGTIVEFEVIATDIFPVVISCDHNSGDTFDVGITTQVTCIVTDSNDNQSSVSFSVTVSPASVTITRIHDGNSYVAFTDGITIENNTPRFRGTSQNVSYFTLDIDGDLVGRNTDTRSDGDWTRKWKSTPLENGTYTLNIKTQNDVNIGVYSITIATPTPMATITHVRDGNDFIPFVDGMTIQNNSPKFVGASENVESAQLLLCDTKVGNSNAIHNSNGAFQRNWKNTPLEDGTCQLVLQSNGTVYFSASITIDANNDGNPESSFITVTDEFENLDSWRFTDTFGIYPPGTYIENNNYNFTRDDSTGNPAPSGLISGDGFIATSTISREIDLVGMHDNPLYLGIDYRVTSQAVGSVVTNAKLEISNSTGGLLYENMLVAGGTLDTNWRTFSLDISEFVQDGDTITVSMISIDPWIANWNQKLYVDNFYIGTSNPAAQNQGASGSLGLDPQPLTQKQLFSKQIAQGNYDLYTHINGVRVAGEYDDVIDELLLAYNVTSGN